MLSYSPRQIVTGLAQRSLMPLVFSELALAYPPAKVSDPNQRVAAANGQFLLDRARSLSAHRRTSRGAGTKCSKTWKWPLLAKRRKVGLRFRYADDAVSTRMYRSTSAMIEGWTKNLALLFNNALALAVWRALDIVLLVGLPILAIELWSAHFATHSLEWLGAGWVLALLVGAHPFPLLRPSRQVEFLFRRLRHRPAGASALCRAALSKLVSAPRRQTGKLEGPNLPGVRRWLSSP